MRYTFVNYTFWKILPYLGHQHPDQEPNGVGITALEIKFQRRSTTNLKQRRALGGLQESLNWLHEELNGYFKVCYLLALSGALAIIPSATSKKERRKKQISILEKYKVFFQ